MVTLWYDYGVEMGDTVILEVWDGMADLLNRRHSWADSQNSSIPSAGMKSYAGSYSSFRYF